MEVRFGWVVGVCKTHLIDSIAKAKIGYIDV